MPNDINPNNINTRAAESTILHAAESGDNVGWYMTPHLPHPHLPHPA